MLELITNPESWTALITLSTLEIILGIDNVVMIAILVSTLPKEKQNTARFLGIGFALVTRVMLLFTLSWLVSLKSPLFHILEHPFSVRDVVMFFGGVFLIYKGIRELVELTYIKEECKGVAKGQVVVLTILQIGIFDIVFSLDSVLTAVAMSNQMPIMVTAIVIAMAVMLFASGYVVKLIDKYISIKVLALAFLILVGVMLACAGFSIEIPKGYIYTSMFFAAFVIAMVIIILKQREKNSKV